MVVARSYQILLPKNDFWPFSHWNSHWSPKNLRTAEGMVVERKQKLFWNQWTKWNILKPCRSWRNQIFWIRITLVHWVLSRLTITVQLFEIWRAHLHTSLCPWVLGWRPPLAGMGRALWREGGAGLESHKTKTAPIPEWGQCLVLCKLHGSVWLNYWYYE